MLQTIERFNQQAVKHNLSAGAILLWQHLFFTMERRKQFADVHQNTAALIAQLEVTRQGLQLMRQSLVDKGFLKVYVDGHQQTFYTLMIDGRVVGEKKDFSTPAFQPALEMTDIDVMDDSTILSSRPERERSGEICSAENGMQKDFGRNAACKSIKTGRIIPV